jgi:transcriptional regulator with XRE-family HTH domain
MIERCGWYAEMTKEFHNDPDYWAEALKLDFAEEVGRLMEEKKVSRAELARRLGTSPAYVTKILHWTANLTLASMSKIALAFGSRVVLALAPKDASLRTKPVRTRVRVRRARQREFVAADRASTAPPNEFIVSDKPARLRRKA